MPRSLIQQELIRVSGSSATLWRACRGVSGDRAQIPRYPVCGEVSLVDG